MGKHENLGYKPWHIMERHQENLTKNSISKPKLQANMSFENQAKRSP